MLNLYQPQWAQLRAMVKNTGPGTGLSAFKSPLAHPENLVLCRKCMRPCTSLVMLSAGVL